MVGSGKRPASTTKTSSASPSKPSKRRKLSDDNDGQSKLESFFASPSKKVAKASTPAGSSARLSPDNNTKSKIKQAVEAVEIIDVDASDSDEVQLAERSSLVNQPQDGIVLASPKGSKLKTQSEPHSREEGQTSPLPSRNSKPPSESKPPSHRHTSISLTSPQKPAPQKPFGMLPTASATSSPVEYPDLGTDPLVFSIEVCPWPTGPGTPAPYGFLAHTFTLLTQTRSRILLTNILTNTLRTIILHHPPSLLPTLYLLSNSLSPAYDPTELNIGPSVISKALQSVSGLSAASLRKLYNNFGDPGDVAFEAKSNVRTLIPHPPLLVPGVYNSLLNIAGAKGNGAGKVKQGIIEKMLVSAKGEESRYLVRTLAQHLRVGAVRTTMLVALARALVLTRPLQSSTPTPSPDSPHYAPPDLLMEVKPLPEKKAGSRNASSKKGDAPATDTSEAAREQIKQLFQNTESLLKRVFVQHPNYGHIVSAILDHGLEALADRVPLTVGVPLHPTLGSPTRSLDEIYGRLGELPFTAEFKYDGQRAQIHASRQAGGQTPIIKIFSRHLEDMTEKYPDIVALVETLLSNTNSSSTPIDSFIMDAEIVAIDPNTGELRSFQELSNRPRKDVILKDVKVAVCVFAFDLMFFNGKVLLEEPFRTRRLTLRTHFPPFRPNPETTTARLDHVESCESTEGRESVEEFFQKAVDDPRSEGLMIKLLDSGEVVVDEGGNEDVVAETTTTTALNSPTKKGRGKSRRRPLPATYEPDKRTSAWLKLKKDYVHGVGDSFDLVPVGAWHGNGRKAKWWSPVLLAVWDKQKGSLVAVCKCMSGFTDAFYQAMAERYVVGSDTCSKVPFKDVECEFGGLVPSVYFRPSEVWELRGADITLSPRSIAALGFVSDQRGLSIRFPRFIRARVDKHPEDATGPELLAELWKKQAGKPKGGGGADDGDLLDVDLEEELIEDDEYDDVDGDGGEVVISD